MDLYREFKCYLHSESYISKTNAMVQTESVCNVKSLMFSTKMEKGRNKSSSVPVTECISKMCQENNI